MNIYDQDDYETILVSAAHAEFGKMLAAEASRSNADRIVVSPTILSVMQSANDSLLTFERADPLPPAPPIEDGCRARHIGYLVSAETRWPVDIDVFRNDSDPTSLMGHAGVVCEFGHKNVRFA